MSRHPVLASTATVALTLALGACGAGTGSGKVAISAGDSSCTVAKTSFEQAGSVTFDVTNTGTDTTEVYVYGKGSDGAFDKVIGEVENIAPGTSRDFEVDLIAGQFEVACKPGQQGDGIRTALAVTGDSGAPADTAYDREVEVTATNYAFSGLQGFAATTGEKIEFKLKNDGTEVEHEFEVIGPDGRVVGEVGPTKPGADGEVVLLLTEAGTYRFVCGIADHESRGMVGSFTVS